MLQFALKSESASQQQQETALVPVQGICILPKSGQSENQEVTGSPNYHSCSCFTKGCEISLVTKAISTA
jgi:hypothetical protein